MNAAVQPNPFPGVPAAPPLPSWDGEVTMGQGSAAAPCSDRKLSQGFTCSLYRPPVNCLENVGSASLTPKTSPLTFLWILSPGVWRTICLTTGSLLFLTSLRWMDFTNNTASIFHACNLHPSYVSLALVSEMLTLPQNIPKSCRE